MVPQELDEAIITGNFWTYDINTNLVNEDFIKYFVQTDNFMDFCKKSSSGATNRRYLQEDIFLNQEIQLPDKKIQGKICQIINNIKIIKQERLKQFEFINALMPSVLAKAFSGEL